MSKMKKKEQNSREKTKWNGSVQSTRCRVQNSGYKHAQELSEDFNSIKNGIETIKKNKSEMTNTVSGMENTLEGINNRLDEVEDWISDLEHKVAENTQWD